MNKNKDKNYWLRLTERYFDALTTDGEEQQLRQFAAVTTDPDFDELRAVMGFSAMAASRRKPKQTAWPMQRWMRYAAAIALIVVVALALPSISSLRATEGECIAYVNGKAIHDEATILSMMTKTAGEVMGTDEALATEMLEDMFETIVIDN